MEIAYKHCSDFRVTEDNRAVISEVFQWCLMIDGRYDPAKGLWLWGNIGTGKSTLLGIVHDFCRIVRPPKDGWPYSFRTSNATDVCSDYASGGYEGIKTYIESRKQAFDELGMETIPTGHYGMGENVMQYILQRRYDRRFDSFTHVTTNFSMEKVKKVYGERLYDRCKEMFNFVFMRGTSFRKNDQLKNQFKI